MTHPLVVAQMVKLRSLAPDASIEDNPDGSAWVVIPNVPLSQECWNQPATTLRFLVPLGYPIARPDGFFTDADLRLAHGGMPVATQPRSDLPGAQPLLWFSWHLTTWDPEHDDLATYYRVILLRLRQDR